MLEKCFDIKLKWQTASDSALHCPPGFEGLLLNPNVMAEY